MSAPIGRPRSCHCGQCFKCKRADYMREWWRSKSAEHRRRLIEGRDPDRVREQDRLKMQKRRRFGTAEQKMKERARAATRQLERQPCEVCGTTENIHAHHDDYTKPLEVRWLCRPHHDELHRELEKAA